MIKEIDKDRLYELYVVEKNSMKEVATLLGCGVGTVHRHIRKLLIETRPTGLNKDGTCWNKGKTYKDDNRILAKKKHPRYIDGRTYPSDYRDMKKKILPCQCDSCEDIATLLHHIDGDIHNNKLSNLKPLCFSCHTIYHNIKRESYKELLKGRTSRMVR
jgi:hypothetical protein